MSNPRLSSLVPVCATVALLVLSLIGYAGFLTSAWGSLLACAPAILVTIGLVGGMLCGMFFFEEEEHDQAVDPSWGARLGH